MKGRFKVLLARIMRAAAVLCLLAFLAVLGRYLIVHKNIPRRVEPQAAQKIPPQKVETEEGIRHFEYKADKQRAEIKADKHNPEPDGRYRLEGHVEVRDFGRNEGQDTWIYGDTVIYDKGMTGYELLGHARVRYKDVSVESETLNYDKKTEILRTSRGAAFVSDKIKGTSQELTYHLGNEALRLDGNVRVELQTRQKKSYLLVFQGQTFEYSRKKKKGSMGGGVIFTSGQSRGGARTMDFVMSADENYLRRLFLKGGVKTHLVDEDKKAPPREGEGLYFQGEERELEAEEISLRAFLGMSKIHSVEARGNCLLQISSSSGEDKTVRAEAMNFIFDRWGGLRKFKAAGGAEMEEKQAAGAGGRFISGDEIFINGQKNTLTAEKKQKSVSRFESAEIDVQAEKITLNRKNEDLGAWRKITAVLKASAEEADGAGFFSRSKPVFVTAQTLRYFRGEKRFVFNEDKGFMAKDEDVKIWQDKAMLLARELSLLEGSREIHASGGTRSFFPRPPKKAGSGESRVEIGGALMLFEPMKNLISYDEDCFLKADTVRLTAKALRVSLKEGQGELKDVAAEGRVSVNQGQREGKGDEGIYVLDEEKFILTGNAVLTDPARGKAEGDKLTFHMADDRILIENKSQKRSRTIIK